MTPESWLSCSCPPSAPAGSPVYKQTEMLCVYPLAKGKQESRTGAYPRAGPVAEAHPHRPRISHRRWHTAPSVNVSFVLNDMSLGWGPGEQPFFFRSLLQRLEAACRIPNRQPRPVTALCCYCHSASSRGTARGEGACWLLSSHQQQHVPLLRGSSGPKWDGLSMMTVKFRERPEARLKNWEEGNISGKGQQERL